MRLLPRDLGRKGHIAVVRQRALGPMASARPVEPHLGRLGRLWTRGMGLPQEVAEETLPLAANETMGVMYGIGGGLGWLPAAGMIVAASLGQWEWAAACGAASGGMAWWCAIDLPRRIVRRLHERPLRAEEIEGLQEATLPGLNPAMNRLAQRFLRRLGAGAMTDGLPADELEQAFLRLARDMARLENVPPRREEDLREALRALGEAVSSLPLPASLDMPMTRQEPTAAAADLRTDADTLLARAAHTEKDPVIAASLRRQADALLRQAEAADRTITINRRTRALRQELRAQIEALRSSLPTFAAGHAATSASAAASAATHTDTGAFAQIAESIQDIAAEAASVASAHDELNAALGPSYSPQATYGATSAQPEDTPLRLRQGRE